MVLPFDFCSNRNKDEVETAMALDDDNNTPMTNKTGRSNGIQWYTFYSEKEGREYCTFSFIDVVRALHGSVCWQSFFCFTYFVRHAFLIQRFV